MSYFRKHILSSKNQNFIEIKSLPFDMTIFMQNHNWSELYLIDKMNIINLQSKNMNLHTWMPIIMN